MGSAERDLRRGSALAAGADWQAANLPAALQGGARRAIFRGLYNGVEAAAQRPGSVSARDGEGRGDTLAGSRDAEAAGFGPHAGLRPSLWCRWKLGRPEPAPLRRERVVYRHSGVDAAGQEVKVQNAGLGCLLEEEQGGRTRKPAWGRGPATSGLPLDQEHTLSLAVTRVTCFPSHPF